MTRERGPYSTHNGPQFHRRSGDDEPVSHAFYALKRHTNGLGLVHGVTAPDRLAAARDHLIEACLKGAPRAQADAKDILRLAADTPRGPDLLRLTAGRLADSIRSEEGRWGLEAFTDGRKPEW